MVCGAGASGVEAALDLADSGLKVYLTDPSAAIGGVASGPGAKEEGAAALAALAPKLEECANHRGVEILTLTRAEAVSGGPGAFKVKLRRSPRYVDAAKCTACGDCGAACPVSLRTAGGERTGRKAIALEHPGAIPNVFGIVKFPGRTACTNDCPAGVNVQGLLSLLRAGKVAEAYALLRRRQPLPASSGRVCRRRCEDKCRRIDIDEEAVAIRNLERFVADAALAGAVTVPRDAAPPRRGKRVAVVGGGPAGLTAANDLALQGVDVTVFEAQERLGGMLRYGIPAWRLPKEVLDREVQSILDLGVAVRTRARVSKPKALLEGVELGGERHEPFDAVFLATGAWTPKKLDLLGESSNGVWQALDFLRMVNGGAAPAGAVGKSVVVLGGDDLALDAARAALRLPGVQTVHLACLESWTEMPVDQDEVETAFQEGVVIHNGLGPTGIEKEGDRAVAVRFRACISVYDEHRSFDPIYDDAMVSRLAADTVVVAAGRVGDAGAFDLETKPGGRVFVYPETAATSHKGIFAGGDAVLGPASMAEAVAGGHRAAREIFAYLDGGDAAAQVADEDDAAFAGVAPNPDPDAEPLERAEMPTVSRAGRLKPDMSEINLGYDKGQALYEAGRCLECGLCSGCMECVHVCPVGAVRHDERPEDLEIEVGGVISTGAASATERLCLSAPGVVDAEAAPDEAFDAEFAADGQGGGVAAVSGAVVRGGAAAAEVLRQLAATGRPATPEGDGAKAALVLGGGVAGMTAARNLADQGFRVHLVEKSDRLGGMLRGRNATLDMENVPEYLQALEKAVRTHPNVRLHLSAELRRTVGRAGDFSSIVAAGGADGGDGKGVEVRHAVTVVATGGRERQTEQYLIGRNPAVVTQSRLGEMLADGSLTTALEEKVKPTIVMMQCVESLTSRYPYCSRVCCAQALGNALEVKSLLPHSEIVVLGGELLAHGAEETAYQKALERRVRFIRYSGTDRPEVGEEGRKLLVRVHDADIGRGLVIYPDLLVLSTGIAPALDNPALARTLGDRLSTDGFFMEAHPRLRPVDSGNEGEFVCGCARAPQFIREAVADARAAAARAAAALRRAGGASSAKMSHCP